MTRGRRPKPDAVKALEGNPGKRKLATRERGDGGAASGVKPAPEKFEPAYFITQEKEREVFNEALRALPPNMIRRSDIFSLSRWAHWMTVWASCKIQLDGNMHWYESKSKHGDLKREHPIAKRMSKAEGHLIVLEDRIGLNPVARFNIEHKLFAMPHSNPPGELFSDDTEGDRDEPPKGEPPSHSAVDYLARARSPIPDGSKPN
jgi:hypothetical protein